MYLFFFRLEYIESRIPPLFYSVSGEIIQASDITGESITSAFQLISVSKGNFSCNYLVDTILLFRKLSTEGLKFLVLPKFEV